MFDFFDFFFVSEDELVLVIADVSGKGISAAMFMTITRKLVRKFVFLAVGAATLPTFSHRLKTTFVQISILQNQH